jgi:hypothetical protein
LRRRGRVRAAATERVAVAEEWFWMPVMTLLTHGAKLALKGRPRSM